MTSNSLRPLVAFFLLTVSMAVNAEETKTQRETRLDVINYGIETEITELLVTLGQEDNKEFTPELTTLFEGTRSVAVREGILALFTKEGIEALSDWAVTLLKDPWDEKRSTVSLALAYAAKLEIRESAESVRNILKNENPSFRDAAIAALGKIGGSDDAAFLSDMLDSELSGDEKQRLIARQAIMTALAEIKDPSQWDRLMEIADNEDENSVIRATAAKALAAIGGERAYDALAKIYESSDPVLREAAMAGAAKIEGADAKRLIGEGLRDSYYKVRLQALNAAKELGMTEASPVILYRAKTDPVESVRVKAYETLAKIGDAESLDWLVSVVRNDKASDSNRARAADALASENKDRAWSVIPEVARKTLTDDKKTWLRYELGKIVVKTDDDRYADLAIEYLSSKDTLTRSIGLDMYDKRRYGAVRARVEAISADEKQGALQKRAKTILETP